MIGLAIHYPAYLKIFIGPFLEAILADFHGRIM
jgi:hypothetical protein